MDASLQRLFGVFNFLEAILWLSVAAGFALAFHRRRRDADLMLAAGLLFFAFGISDFVEIHTGAWFRPWWLFVWKAACVTGFPIVFVLFWRRKRSVANATPATEASVAGNTLRLPVPRWVTAIWRSAYLALLAAGCLLLFLPVVRVDQESCSRIHAGMTLAEAGQIIGAPPGWYDGVCRIDVGTLLGKGGRPYWVGGQGAIVLELDAEGRVVQATFHPGKVIERPPLDFLAERLVLRWFYRE